MLSTSTLTVYCARGAITAETPVSRNTPELIGTLSHLIYCKSAGLNRPSHRGSDALAECTPCMKQGPFPREEERRRTKQQMVNVQLRANVALGRLISMALLGVVSTASKGA